MVDDRRQAGAETIELTEAALEAAAWVLADHIFAEGQPTIETARSLISDVIQTMREADR